MKASALSFQQWICKQDFVYSVRFLPWSGRLTLFPCSSCAMIPDDEADIAILEEPEHLNWLRVPPDSKEEKSMLGWQFKFNFVVGIMHTNYRSYAEQSGLATSLIGAPALASLSSMVVRAYCHRVIRLSATLPVLDQEREKTCNVHGVRSEFFEEPEDTNCDVTEPSAIYFIGKLVWAKGFDKLLEMEDLFKQTWGEYFQIDIYGSGNDKDSIQRAFFGRRGIVDMGDGTSNQDEEVNDSVLDRSAAQLFGATGSLRDQLQPEGGSEEPPGQRTRIERTCEPDPLQILGELSGKSIETSLSTTAAVGDICKQATYFGFHGTFSEYSKEDDSSKGYRLDLPKSKFEFRRHPIPARFLGTKDHAVIKNIPSHRIFLNLSESEVLCTTTAEALAMGKWVIIPEHRKFHFSEPRHSWFGSTLSPSCYFIASNTFFVQFSNCLAFSSKEDCIEKIRHALSNDPQPLSKEAATMLSWEGANNRLFDAALMTRTEYEERENSKDKDLANLHIHSSKYLHSFQSAVMTTFNF
eukprot:scaffold1375_cov137-Cylindrotheca_fusiformis.AAC.2